MSIQVKMIAWLLSVSVVFIAAFACFKYGRYVENLAMTKKLNEVSIKQLSEFNSKLTIAEEQHDKDARTITELSRKSRGVRVVIPSCPTEATGDTDASSGVADNRVQSAFDRFRQGTERLIDDCATLNADAIRANAVR